MKKEHVISSLEEMYKLAVFFVEEFLGEYKGNQNDKDDEDNNNKENKSAVVFGLSGDLGSGKTTFTQCVAKCLGIEDVVTSPTFVIEKVYKIYNEKYKNTFEHLIHIDAYRLENGEEIERLGWKDVLSNKKNLILVEWPENIDSAMPKNYKQIKFEHLNEGSRKITLP